MERASLVDENNEIILDASARLYLERTDDNTKVLTLTASDLGLNESIQHASDFVISWRNKQVFMSHNIVSANVERTRGQGTLEITGDTYVLNFEESLAQYRYVMEGTFGGGKADW
jgi:hypothetical protein